MFLDLPRWFSFPKQVYVEYKVGLNNLLNLCNGKVPCYMVPYVCPTKTSVIVDSIVNDFDHKELNIPYDDVRKSKQFYEENGIGYNIDFSGNKGFHIFPGIKPIEVDLTNETEKLEVKTKVANIQLSLQNHLNLMSLDPKVIGDIRRVIRIPTTKYVHKTGYKNGLYCRYLSPEQFDEGLEFILQIAREPGNIPHKPDENVTIDEFIDLIPNYKIYKTYSGSKYSKALNIGSETAIPTIESLCPCMVKIYKSSKPLHDARREMVCWLKFMGYKDKPITAFFRNSNWRDFTTDKTLEQVYTINPRRPKCSLLKRIYPDADCSKCPLTYSNNKSNKKYEGEELEW